MAALLLTFVLIDGLVTRNSQAWAAPFRAGLVAALFICGVVMLWRARVRVEPGAMIMIGVLAALTISEVYQSYAGIGLTSWLVYAGAYALQRALGRDWRSSIANMGVALAVLCFVVAAGTLAGTSKPTEMWNRNTIGGILVVTLPAAMTLNKRWRVGVILAGIAVTISRGAWVAAFVALAVMIQPWALLAAPVAAVALVTIRQHEADLRWLYWYQGIQAFLSSPLFGVGQGRLITAGDGVAGVAIHCHNSLLGIVAQVGILGTGIIASALAVTRRVTLQRWQWAMLAAVAAHSLVDDPLCWLPVGVIVALCIQNSCDDGKHNCHANDC
jgi:hypothetical protein